MPLLGRKYHTPSPNLPENDKLFPTPRYTGDIFLLSPPCQYTIFPDSQSIPLNFSWLRPLIFLRSMILEGMENRNYELVEKVLKEYETYPETVPVKSPFLPEA